MKAEPDTKASDAQGLRLLRVFARIQDRETAQQGHRTRRDEERGSVRHDVEDAEERRSRDLLTARPAPATVHFRTVRTRAGTPAILVHREERGPSVHRHGRLNVKAARNEGSILERSCQPDERARGLGLGHRSSGDGRSRGTHSGNAFFLLAVPCA